ncbi:rhodanese-like domain-containing protein [uncultured Cocleimonas sp.]|uniref:rhodanese-like domain-containing protein n=1 Tax=uncultured Cocleimonas sp. TaxID=1051587 RepID=UPI002605032A|nr:rhodanese-like domain-containing protein [uncultured Cocleimonas sp.]
MHKYFFILLLITISMPSAAYDKSKLTKKWQHTPYDLYLSAKEAYEMKTSNPEAVLLLDVRNEAEIHYTGIPDTVDANIPYRFDSNQWKMKKKGKFGTFKMPKNKHFVAAIKNVLKAKNMSTDHPVIIMCASGNRAPFAVKALHEAGFKEVYSQVEGFEGIRAKDGKDKGTRTVSGWKVSGLPWSYDLVPQKMYFNFAPAKTK